MELYLNELSIPLSPNNALDPKIRILDFLKTAQALNAYDFNHIRVHNGFYAEDLGDGYTVSNFLADSSNKLVLRTLLQSIIKNPFIPDDDSYEAEAFILNKFETVDEQNISIEPEGLAAAYVFESQSISFSGNTHWERESMTVLMTNPQGEIFPKEILNHAFESCIYSQTFLNWHLSLKERIPLDSIKNIQIVFPPSQFEFEPQAINELISWYYDDVRYQIRIKQLIEDIKLHPFTGGLGHTETLTRTGGKASKRIIGKDRLVYTYTNKKIIIHQCRGHYEDH